MKCYFDYSGAVPSGVKAVREGLTTRVFFDYSTETRKDMDGEDVTVLTAENVDVESSDYGDIVNAIVRDRYAADKVEAIMANYQEAMDSTSSLTEDKRAEYKAEYEAFQAWRAKAKEVATATVGQISA